MRKWAYLLNGSRLELSSVKLPIKWTTINPLNINPDNPMKYFLPSEEKKTENTRMAIPPDKSIILTISLNSAKQNTALSDNIRLLKNMSKQIFESFS